MKKIQGKDYAPIAARFGIGIVFLLFGISQAFNPIKWVAWLPPLSFKLGFEPITLIYLNGFLEIFLGVLLILGLFVRIISFIGVIHLAGIILSLGYNDISIRDFGLLMALISVWLYGPDECCLDKIWKRNV